MESDKRRDLDLGEALRPPGAFPHVFQASKNLFQSLTKRYLPVLKVKADLFSYVRFARSRKLQRTRTKVCTLIVVDDPKSVRNMPPQTPGSGRNLVD